MIKRLSYALLLFAIAGLNQQASAASTGAASRSNSQIQQRTLPDAEIERIIKAKLAKSKIGADHFTVSVSKGVATVEGSTNVIQHKGAMTRMAKASGATSVRNNIRISAAARAKAAANFSKIRTGAAPPPRATMLGNPVTPQAGTPAPQTSQNTAPVNTASVTPAIPRAVVLPQQSAK